MSGQSSGSGGISFLGVLGIVFIVLKLCGVIDWSWYLVLLPLYGGLAIVGIVMLIAVIIMGVIALYESSSGKRR